MESVHIGVPGALREVQFRAPKRGLRAWVWDLRLRVLQGITGETSQKLLTPFVDLLGQIVLAVIGKKWKWARRAELLTHKQERRLGREQHERRQRAVARGAGQGLQSLASQMIRDLIVVLREEHERARRLGRHGCASWPPPPDGPLSLIQKSSLDGRDEFLGLAVIVAVVGFTLSRERDMDAMMEIVVPDGVQAQSAF